MAKGSKTHKATAKRFRVTRNKKVIHQPQGGGNGHSRNYMSRSQKKSRSGNNTLSSKKESKKIITLAGK